MLDEICKPIIKRAQINNFVETGLFLGETIALVSRWFSEMYPHFGKIVDYKDYCLVGPNPWNTSILYPQFNALEIVNEHS
tara:strand:+ start:621 stop:860 length:240 start_codon:yes stop_codon:yes gene_type:complete